MDLEDQLKGMPLEDQFNRDGTRRMVDEYFSPEQAVIIMRLFDLSELHRSVINRNVELQSGAGQETCTAIALLSEAVGNLNKQVIFLRQAGAMIVRNVDGSFSAIMPEEVRDDS